MIIIPKDKKSVNIFIPKGYSDVIEIANVSNLQTKSIDITNNGSISITPDSGYYALNKVNIDVDVQPQLENINITENGTYKSTDYYGYDEVNVNVKSNLTNINITENGEYLPEGGYDGFNKVNVNIPKPQLENINITKNGTYKSTDYYGYDEVNVNIPSKGLDIDLSSIGWNGNDISNYTTQTQSDLEYTKSVMGKKTFEDDNRLVYAPVITGLSGTIGNLFSGCYRLFAVPELDVSEATYFSFLFANCYSIHYINGIENWNTSKVMNMQRMFQNCISLNYLNLSGWDTSSVTDMNYMFYGCSGLTSLDVSNFNTSNVTNMSYMFKGCGRLTSLDVSKFNTSNVTNMLEMFSSCSGLTSLDLTNFDTSKVTNMGYMFQYCSGLTSLDLSGWDFSNIKTSSFYNGVYNMFGNSGKLYTINLTNAKMENMGSMNGMFGYTPIKNLNLDGVTLPNINLNNVGFNYSGADLTVESLLGILNALPLTTNGYTLTLGSKHLNKLTDEQKAIATNKGWTLN